VTNTLWTNCIECLQQELPAQQFNTWIRPLQVDRNGTTLRLLAPNRFVKDWVAQRYLERINEIVVGDPQANGVELVEVIIGSKKVAPDNVESSEAIEVAPKANTPPPPADSFC